jgi:hypothetical protein
MTLQDKATLRELLKAELGERKYLAKFCDAAGYSGAYIRRWFTTDMQHEEIQEGAIKLLEEINTRRNRIQQKLNQATV